jgi:hypothetical protein
VKIQKRREENEDRGEGVGSGDDGETGSRDAGTRKARSEGVREWRKGRKRSSVTTIPKKEKSTEKMRKEGR